MISNVALDISDTFSVSPEDNREELLREARERAEKVRAAKPFTLIDEISASDWKNWDTSTEVAYFADEDDEGDEGCVVLHN